MKLINVSLVIFCFSSLICCQQTGEKNKAKVMVVDSIQNSNTETLPLEIAKKRKDSIDVLKQVKRLKAIKASEKCKTEFLVKIRNNIGHLTYQQILSFLENFNDLCELNIEYSEFNNYLLFSILRSQPELVLKVISENKTIQYHYINKNLTNPINDTINLNGIYKNIEAVKGYDQIKDSLLTSIKIAIDNYN